MDQDIVELHFPVAGSTLPSDHAYPIFSALCQRLPELHDADWLGIHSFKGMRTRPGKIRLREPSYLKLRLPAHKIPVALKLAGARLNIAGHYLNIGLPNVQPLTPASRLRARLVMVKLADQNSGDFEGAFLAAVQKQVRELGVNALVELERAKDESRGEKFARRTVRIKDVVLPGYGVILHDLTDEDSIRIQQYGLGGRRRFGCGLFMPISDADIAGGKGL